MKKPSRLVASVLVAKDNWDAYKDRFSDKVQRLIVNVFKGMTYKDAAKKEGMSKQAAYFHLKKLYKEIYGTKYSQKEEELIIGIDPGTNGAIAYMTRTGKLVRLVDMPKESKIIGKGEQVSIPLLIEELSKFKIHKAVIEQVGSMPGNSGRSMFTFGRALGAIEAVLVTMDIEISWIRPADWKRKYKLTGKNKDVARSMAMQLYPLMASELKRKKDIDRAEAILIAKTEVTE